MGLIVNKRFIIDAVGINSGGGLAHVTEFLSALQSSHIEKGGFTVCFIASTDRALSIGKSYENIEVIEKSGSVGSRLWWHIWGANNFTLQADAQAFVSLSGLSRCSCIPSFNLIQNQLPFWVGSYFRYGFSAMSLRLFLILALHLLSMTSAHNVFMSKASLTSVPRLFRKRGKSNHVIHHSTPRDVVEFFERNLIVRNSSPGFTFVYLSDMDVYKQHLSVLTAFKRVAVHQENLRLIFIGSGYSSQIRKVQRFINNSDLRESVEILSDIGREEVFRILSRANVGIWASECETFGIVLLEYLEAGLDILAFENDVTEEVLEGNDRLFFNGQLDLEFKMNMLIYSSQHSKTIDSGSRIMPSADNDLRSGKKLLELIQSNIMGR